MDTSWTYFTTKICCDRDLTHNNYETEWLMFQISNEYRIIIYWGCGHTTLDNKHTCMYICKHLPEQNCNVYLAKTTTANREDAMKGPTNSTRGHYSKKHGTPPAFPSSSRRLLSWIRLHRLNPLSYNNGPDWNKKRIPATEYKSAWCNASRRVGMEILNRNVAPSMNSM